MLHECMSCRYSCAHRARGKCVHIFYHRPTQLRHHIAPNRCWSPDRDRPVGRPSSSHGKTRFVVHTYGGDQMHRRQDKRARVHSHARAVTNKYYVSHAASVVFVDFMSRISGTTAEAKRVVHECVLLARISHERKHCALSYYSRSTRA